MTKEEEYLNAVDLDEGSPREGGNGGLAGLLSRLANFSDVEGAVSVLRTSTPSLAMPTRTPSAVALPTVSRASPSTQPRLSGDTALRSDAPHREKLIDLGCEDNWEKLRNAVEGSDVTKHYGNPRFPIQLRMLAEVMYGSGPGGSDGTSMRKMMLAMEGGEMGDMRSAHST